MILFSSFRLRPDTGTGTARSTVVLSPKSQNWSLQTSAHRDAIVVTEFLCWAWARKEAWFHVKISSVSFQWDRASEVQSAAVSSSMNVSLETVLQYRSKAEILLSSPGFKRGLTITGIAWGEWRNKVSDPKASLRALAYPCWNACNTHPCRHIPCNLAGVYSHSVAIQDTACTPLRYHTPCPLAEPLRTR